MIGFIFLLAIALIAYRIGRNSASFKWQTKDQSPDRSPMTFTRAFLLLFLSGWIIAWSAGVVTAIVMFVRSFGDGLTTLFLAGWLLVALAGWGFAALTIYKIITGQPIRLRGGQVY